jgi:hypothetical protein
LTTMFGFKGKNEKKKSLLERLVIIESSVFSAEPVSAAEAAVSSVREEIVAEEPTISVLMSAKEEEPAEERLAEEPVIIVTESELNIAEPEIETENSGRFFDAGVNREEKIDRTTFFDILEKARDLKEAEEKAEEIRIEYSVPKRIFVKRDNDYEEVREDFLDFSKAENPGAAEISPEEPQEADADEMAETGPELGSDSAYVKIAVEEQPVVVDSFASDESAQASVPADLDRVLFPDEYFYASNGAVIKNLPQLMEALGSMDDGTFAHHTKERDSNDFANWINGVYGHHKCADDVLSAKEREEMRTALEKYL